MIHRVVAQQTYRENLDPFRDHEDATLLSTLERVHLLSSTPNDSSQSSAAPSVHEASEGRPGTPSSGSHTAVLGEEQKSLITLDSKVSAGGSNFSQGQRQVSARFGS